MLRRLAAGACQKTGRQRACANFRHLIKRSFAASIYPIMHASRPLTEDPVIATGGTASAPDAVEGCHVQAGVHYHTLFQ